MRTVPEIDQTAALRAVNIGGIDETEVSFAPGVTLLTGRNATNRTSLLQATMAALGSERATLKGDADAGEATLRIGEETYTRTLTRAGQGVQYGGEPYLESATSADLFAFLLGDNESRRAVLGQGDLRDVIMRPVDTEAIREEISALATEQREVESKLETLDQAATRLTDRQTERDRLEKRLSNKEAELEAKRETLEQADRDLERGRERETEADQKLDELRSVRSSLDRVRERFRTNESSIEALQDELAEQTEELEEFDATPAGERSDVEARIEELRDRKSSLDSTINRLREIVRFNEEMLEGDTTLLDSIESDSADETTAAALTSELVDGPTRTCWTCGNEVEADSIESVLDQLRGLVEDRLDERTAVESKLSDLTDRKRTLESQQRDREALERKIEQIRSEVAERETTAEDLREERDALEAEVGSLEDAVEALQSDEYDEVLSLQKEVNQLEFERSTLREDLDDLTDDVEALEAKLSARDELEERRETITTELRDLRTRIERLEADAVDEFNEHMETVLSVLQYENVERIWLERRETEVRDGRRKVTRGTFDLHVVRSTDEGVTYEDTVDHLSESEQNVTGLVFALAGYLAHDVYETCPFMLLDSLEAIDSERIVDLVEYFADYSAYLVVALLPEDEAAFDDDVNRVTSI